MGLRTLLFPGVFLLFILFGPSEVDALGIMSFAAKTLTRFKMRLDARLRPNKEDDVVRKPYHYTYFA